MMGNLFGPRRSRWTVPSQAGPAPLRGDGAPVSAGAVLGCQHKRQRIRFAAASYPRRQCRHGTGHDRFSDRFGRSSDDYPDDGPAGDNELRDHRRDDPDGLPRHTTHRTRRDERRAGGRWPGRRGRRLHRHGSGDQPLQRERDRTARGRREHGRRQHHRGRRQRHRRAEQRRLWRLDRRFAEQHGRRDGPHRAEPDLGQLGRRGQGSRGLWPRATSCSETSSGRISPSPTLSPTTTGSRSSTRRETRSVGWTPGRSTSSRAMPTMGS